MNCPVRAMFKEIYLEKISIANFYTQNKKKTIKLNIQN